jgi:hypothetical protein
VTDGGLRPPPRSQMVKGEVGVLERAQLAREKSEGEKNGLTRAARDRG